MKTSVEYLARDWYFQTGWTDREPHTEVGPAIEEANAIRSGTGRIVEVVERTVREKTVYRSDSGGARHVDEWD